MSAAPQIQTVAQLRSTHGFTIVRLGSSQAAKKSTTPPLSSDTILVPLTPSSSNVQSLSTPSDSLLNGVPDAVVQQRRGAETPAGVATPSQSPPKTPPPTGGDDRSRSERQSSRGAVTSTPPDLDNSDTVCLIGSDCYKPPYIPMMFYDEA